MYKYQPGDSVILTGMPNPPELKQGDVVELAEVDHEYNDVAIRLKDGSLYWTNERQVKFLRQGNVGRLVDAVKNYRVVRKTLNDLNQKKKNLTGMALVYDLPVLNDLEWSLIDSMLEAEKIMYAELDKLEPKQE